MSEISQISASLRERAGKGAARAARREGFVPAVIYGDKKDPVMIKIEARPLRKMLESSAFFTNLVDVELDGKKHRVLPRDVALHPVTMHFSDQADALAQLEPREDGVILATPEARGTFLPHVWEGLGDREDFLKALKRKAGLAEDFWSDEVQLYRFRTESFASSVAPLLQDSH